LLLARLFAVKGMAWAAEFSNVAAFFVGLLALLTPFSGRWLRSLLGISPVSVDDVADHLAKFLDKQWETELQQVCVHGQQRPGRVCQHPAGP